MKKNLSEQVNQWGQPTLTESFHPKNALIGVTYEELITTIQSNEDHATDEMVMKAFDEIVQSQLQDARFLLKKNMKAIHAEIQKGWD